MISPQQIYYIYILECTNNAYYTGYSTDINRRYGEHKQGSWRCKYTRSFPPKRIAALWQINADLALVLKIECLIKKLTKSRKLQLLANPEQLIEAVEKLGYRDIDFRVLNADHCYEPP